MPLASEGVENNKNIEVLLQPTLPDLNEVSRRKSSCKSKQTEKAKESKDPALNKIFSLVAMVRSFIFLFTSQPFAFAAQTV